MMRVFIKTKTGNTREIEAPGTWDEARAMLKEAMGAHYDQRGGNLHRLSVAVRIAHGMFPTGCRDPTLSLLTLLYRLVERERAR